MCVYVRRHTLPKKKTLGQPGFQTRRELNFRRRRQSRTETNGLPRGEFREQTDMDALATPAGFGRPGLRGERREILTRILRNCVSTLEKQPMKDKKACKDIADLYFDIEK